MTLQLNLTDLKGNLVLIKLLKRLNYIEVREIKKSGQKLIDEAEKDFNPQYIYEITSDMVTKQGRFPSFAKCQIISAFTLKDI
ncbi:MAG: hypothetical protein U5L45_21230 [Saprospiraceae bacterium]|nr:hypothetical protein [Saprospiraceae bacterium]